MKVRAMTYWCSMQLNACCKINTIFEGTGCAPVLRRMLDSLDFQVLTFKLQASSSSPHSRAGAKSKPNNSKQSEYYAITWTTGALDPDF